MAERRMFAKSIIDSDAFLDMPLTTQALYFHLSMRADDDGFINSPKRIMRTIGCSEDDLKLLILKRFIIPFESSVVVIKHWKIHNYIQNDRYKPTNYIDEKNQLSVKKNKAYSLKDECIQNVSITDTQDRLGKDSIGKYIENDNNIHSVDNLKANAPSLEDVKGFWIYKGFRSDPEEFYYYYQSIEWKNPNGSLVTDWKSKAVLWEKRESEFKEKKKSEPDAKKSKYINYDQRDNDYDELEKILEGRL